MSSTPQPPSAEESDEIVAAMLEMLLNLSDDIFASGNAAGFAPLLDYVSPAMTRLFGWPTEQLLGRNPLEFTHPDDVQRVASMLATVVDGSVPCAHVMLRFLHVDGSYKWLHAQYCREDDLLVCVARDATLHKNTEAALREYLLSTSHDLRTPCHGAQRGLGFHVRTD